STILHDLSHVLPTDDEFLKDMEENVKRGWIYYNVYLQGDKITSASNRKEQLARPIRKKCKESVGGTAKEFSSREETNRGKIVKDGKAHKDQRRTSITADTAIRTAVSDSVIISENSITKEKKSVKCSQDSEIEISRMHLVQPLKIASNSRVTYERKRRHSKRQTNARAALQHKPKSISTAKERRGVKVFGIILGCFAICWTPFFIMYVLVQFCSSCQVDPHIWMFITWLGYSNSAMNPIIYTIKQEQREAYNNTIKSIRTSKILTKIKQGQQDMKRSGIVMAVIGDDIVISTFPRYN
ncbi:unnamed protein product, partial [Acanthocheilonema viteae]